MPEIEALKMLSLLRQGLGVTMGGGDREESRSGKGERGQETEGRIIYLDVK